MNEYAEMMDSIDAAAGAINSAYLPALERFLTEEAITGLIVSRCQVAQSATPQPVTAVAFTERDPYTHPDRFAQSLAEVAEGGYLTAVSPTAYALTEKGAAIANKVLALTKETGASVQPLPAADMARLVALLEQVVTAIAASDAPTTCLRRSRFFDPGVDAPAAERARRYLNDLLAFRDDAHLAAWGGLGVSGPAWEGFGHITAEHTFGDPAPTAAALAEKLTFRGYSAADYATFLQPLVAKGWLTLADDTYALTENGRFLRADIEAKTDAIFYEPWPLTPAEIAELQTLLTAVAAAIQPEPA